MSNVIRIERTNTCQKSSSTFPRIGPAEMETPRGTIAAFDAPGLLVMHIDRSSEPDSIAVMVYEPKPGHGQGLIFQMSADVARATAASLLRLADQIEPVRHDA